MTLTTSCVIDYRCIRCRKIAPEVVIQEEIEEREQLLRDEMYEGKISNLGAEIILLTQRHDTDKGKHSFKISKFCLSIKGFQIYAAETRIKLYTFKNYPPPLGMDCLHFFEKRSFCFENDKEETKNETIVFKNDRFSY